jgi:hypothetical protein
MPITWAEFEFGAKDTASERWMRSIQGFLRDHPKLAYSESELRHALSCPKRAAESDEFLAALTLLAELGSIDERFLETRGENYYKYISEIPELPMLTSNRA